MQEANCIQKSVAGNAIISVAYFTKEVNPRLAQRSLKSNGHLANLELTYLVKESAGG